VRERVSVQIVTGHHERRTIHTWTHPGTRCWSGASQRAYGHRAEASRRNGCVQMMPRQRRTERMRWVGPFGPRLERMLVVTADRLIDQLDPRRNQPDLGE
jgi:hypothetical protein